MNRLDFQVKEGDKVVKYYVKKPNQKEMNDADLIYRTKYSEALRKGALTNSEAMKIIESRDIWSDEDDKTLVVYFRKLGELGGKLKEVSKIVDAMNIIHDMEQVRLDILKINMKRNSILNNTAESYADDYRLQAYAVCCTFDENNNLVFKNTEDYYQKAETPVATEAMRRLIHLLANNGKDFRHDWPEYQWRLKNGLVDENLNPVEGALEKIIDTAKEESQADKKKD